MMALLVFVLAALVFGALFGTLVARDAGYVLVAYDNLSLETSLWFALLALIVLYFLLRIVAISVSGFLRTRLGLKLWNEDRIAKKSRDRSVKGLLLMAEGKWLEAKNTLVSGAVGSEIPLNNYLNAAKAAHQLKDFAERDALLVSAHDSTPGSRLAVGFVKAELELDQQQWEAALATLLELKAQSSTHPKLLSMLVSCYTALEDWAALVELAPQLKKKKVMHENELARIELKAWQSQLGEFVDSSSQQLLDFWSSAPTHMAQNPSMLFEYASLLLSHGLNAEVESLLVKALNRDWNENLINLYGKFRGEDTARQQAKAESWLKQHPEDATLFLCLGRLSVLAGDWTKAQEYFESSLRLKKTVEAYSEMARLCMVLEDHARGREYMTRAMVLSGDIQAI